MTVNPFIFFGMDLTTDSVELLGTGTHTRTDNFGGTTTATVGPGQLGGYVLMSWGGNTGMGTFMVWDITPSSDGGNYTAIDSDGDGSPGHAFVAGPFIGATLVYQFTVGEPPPGISVTASVSGGNIQECSETGGSTVDISATVTLIGGTQLGGIDWYINGENAGNGTIISPFIELGGTHSVDVVATTLTGESNTSSTSVTVGDTTAPELEIGFVNNTGQFVTSISAGNHVAAHIKPVDVCDPAPVAEGAAVPVFEVADGDIIKLQGGKVNTVELPTTSIELSGKATDASGNSKSGMSVLSITD
jgi:hypothetical protein